MQPLRSATYIPAWNSDYRNTKFVSRRVHFCAQFNMEVVCNGKLCHGESRYPWTWWSAEQYFFHQHLWPLEIQQQAVAVQSSLNCVYGSLGGEWRVLKASIEVRVSSRKYHIKRTLYTPQQSVPVQWILLKETSEDHVSSRNVSMGLVTVSGVY